MLLALARVERHGGDQEIVIDDSKYEILCRGLGMRGLCKILKFGNNDGGV